MTQSSVADDAVPAQVRDAWQAVVASWDDRARHDALLGVVTKHQCYAWAAARYRERAGDPVADAQLERLRKAALATMFATGVGRRDSKHKPFRATLVGILLLMIAIVVGFIYMASARHNHRAPITKPISP